VTGGYDNSIRFWDITNGNSYRTIQYPESQVNKIVIAPNKRFILLSGNPLIRLYDLMSNNPQPLRTYTGHKNNVVCIGFGIEGNWFYSGSEDGNLKIWDINSQGETKSFPYEYAITSVALYVDQKHIVCTNINGVVRIINIEDNEVKRSFFPGEDHIIQAITFNQKGNILVGVSTLGNCWIWDTTNINSEWPILRSFQAHNSYILSCKLNAESKLLATCGSDNTIKIWDITVEGPPTLLKTFTEHQKWVWDCEFSTTSNYLISVSSDCTAILWDLQEGIPIRKFKGAKPITCISLGE